MLVFACSVSIERSYAHLSKLQTICCNSQVFLSPADKNAPVWRPSGLRKFTLDKRFLLISESCTIAELQGELPANLQTCYHSCDQTLVTIHSTVRGIPVWLLPGMPLMIGLHGRGSASRTSNSISFIADLQKCYRSPIVRNNRIEHIFVHAIR